MKEDLSLSVSRTFKCDAKTLFNAIGEGMLIKSTGAIPEKLKFDFKEGGKYSAVWETCDETQGEFLEIVPHSKIVFTWNKTPKSDSPFESKVTLLIEEAGGVTSLHLKHEGLPGMEECKSHTGGWEHTLEGMYKQLPGHFAEA